MKELARPAIVGFLAGVIGALLVVWFNTAGEPPAEATSQENAGAADLYARVAALEKEFAAGVTAPEASPQKEIRIEPETAERPATARADSLASDRSSENYMTDYLKKKRERTSEQLRAAGWSDAEIQSLEDLKMAASLEMEERMYEQMRKAVDENPWVMGWGQSHVLRDSMGEEKYEQYRAATGRPTAIKVNSVLRGSAGEAAGLMRGDQIRRYGADRVYDEQDLMMSALKGEPGEPVTIEIERDGAIFHITVPRGPLGTSQIASMMINN